MGDFAHLASAARPGSSAPAEQQEVVKMLDNDRIMPATYGHERPLTSYAAHSAHRLSSDHSGGGGGGGGVGPAPLLLHERASRFDIVEQSSGWLHDAGARRHSQNIDQKIGNSASHLEPPMPSSPWSPHSRDGPLAPPIFSLPPLASLHTRNDNQRSTAAERSKTCRSCDYFGILVAELTQITALLLHDMGQSSEEAERQLAQSQATGISTDAQINVSHFHRSLQYLRTFRRNLQMLDRPATAYAGSSGHPSPEERRRSHAAILSAPTRQSMPVSQSALEPPSKRLRYSSPEQRTGELATQASDHLGSIAHLNQDVSHGEGLGPIRSPGFSHEQFAPPSPYSDLSSRPLGSSHSTRNQDEPRRRASVSGPLTHHHALEMSDDPSSVVIPPISTASANSVAHSTSSSAESSHYANLQRQVTLKTLSLQTLQSEYSSLLQKLHRERLRSQTIERKSSVAESEVNALSTQNEELTEHIKALNGQVETCESKIDSMRAEFNRDKAQWVSMLSNDTKIMSRFAEDKKLWAEEKARLQASIYSFERVSDASPLKGMDTPVQSQAFRDEVVVLQARVVKLTESVTQLRGALADCQQDNRSLETHARALIDAIAASDEKTSRALSHAP